MPWCPQCRAEYREGFTRCHRCGVPLAQTPPAQRPWVESAPPLLLRAAGQAASAWQHAAAALRLLKRRPSLLLLPLALAFFNVVERQAGQYATFRYTAFGRELPRRLADDLPRPVKWSLVRRVRVVETVRHFAGPIPGLTLTGTTQLAWIAAIGGKDTARWPGHQFWALLAATALVAALSALVLAGYYGVAGLAVASGEAPWAVFAQQMRRFWLRFWLFQLVLNALAGWLSYVSLAVPLPTLIAAANWWLLWLAPVICFLLALSLFAIAADNARLGEAMGHSIVTVCRGLLTALLLFLALGLLRAIFLAPLSEAAELLFGPPSRTDLLARTLLDIPWFLAAEGWDALLGTWLCLALFFWYRDSVARGVALEAADSLPIPSPQTP